MLLFPSVKGVVKIANILLNRHGGNARERIVLEGIGEAIHHYLFYLAKAIQPGSGTSPGLV
ncbi:hypothetical protein [Arcticibacter tournemirensis]|uniref:Uncharacterized protein n=1 Tax=Arcticibacter tournemirensis TaxID=699437 RepID=A0A4Q0MCC9_9SPHI|nr:hypothetical protein [Arcticibacter tournemirensis]RXF70998.1 hypothetical protein EKH83_04620 [Arcticibacter tournemirensis]